jgi:hypothetical protein
MSKYESLKAISNEQFKRLVGINREVFKSMVNILNDNVANRASKAGRKAKLSMEDRLLMLLEYYREYRTYFHISKSYGMSESATFDQIVWMEGVLIKHPDFHLPGKKALVEENNYTRIAVDATEVEIQRPKKNKKNTIQEKRKSIL